MIVVENGSQDRGPQIVECFQQKDCRIQLLNAPHDVQGPGAARNLGVQKSCGDWILFLDADDLVLPEHFSKITAAHATNPESDLISCDWLEGPEYSPGVNILKRPPNASTVKDVASSAIAYTPWVPHAACMARKLLGDDPVWNVRFDKLLAEDHVFWFKVLLSAKVSYSQHTGVFYRTDARNRRHNLSDTTRYLQIVDLCFQANLDLLGDCGRPLNYTHRKMLLNAYLEHSLALDKSHEWQLRIRERILRLRPSFFEGILRKDVAVVASYLIPHAWLAKIQKRRRANAK
jgi:glycosyltransferase involved in cell wall biosynthesis